MLGRKRTCIATKKLTYMLFIIDHVCISLPSSDLDLDAEAPPAKKARVEDDTDFSMASLARGEVKQVRTLYKTVN